MIIRNKYFIAFTILMSLCLFAGLTAAQEKSPDTNTKTKTKSSSKEKRNKTNPIKEKVLYAAGAVHKRKLQGEDKDKDRDKDKYRGKDYDDNDNIRAARKADDSDRNEKNFDNPTESKLKRAGTFTGDLRQIPYKKPIRIDRPEREAPNEESIAEGDPVEAGSGLPDSPSAAAPSPIANFLGLDFQNFGAGRPPDTNGDVGPNYFIQSVNSSIGIYNKSNGTRVVGLTLNSFMSQGNFGNLCDTNNFGDPVVLYDTFEDRWIITDFAFTLDGSGNVTSNSYQCFAASKTGDPVAGGWNFYSTVDTDYLGDYPKFGVWNDGIYMSANMFGFSSSGSYAYPRVRSLNKFQMYAGEPTVQVVTFNAPSEEFTLMPANARLQTGIPPLGSPNYFTVVSQYTNAISTYKFHVDWKKISTSTFTGPSLTFAPASWSSAPATVPVLGGNANDTLATRLMMQNQYTNIGGVESLWNTHTVRGSTTTQAAVRYYQVNVTGGTIAVNTTQATTHNPDAALSRYMPSSAVNRAGDMAMVYSTSGSAAMSAIQYAGRLSTDALNTLPQTEQLLVQSTGSQNTSTRWGDYSAMTLDPDGCTFWMTTEYYITTGGNWQTRIGSFAFPSCVPSSSGTLQGTVTSSVTNLPINGATVSLGSRTTTTDAGGFYSFAGLPSGTYITDTAKATGYNLDSANNIVISDGSTTTQNFSLGTAVASDCLPDTSQSDFQNGIPANLDLSTTPGDVALSDTPSIDQQNTSVTTSGFGVTSTAWVAQTFTAATTGQMIQADLNLFCSGCTGTTPNLTVSIRATSGSPAIPTGGDLATATIPGFNSASGGYFSAAFTSPPTLTAGTRYALIVRPVSNPSTGTYAYVCSCSSPNSNPYANGQRVTSANSGSTWTADTTSGGRDLGFRIYMKTGYATSGTLISGIKDSNPVADGTTKWTTLAWTANIPTNTNLRFQVAGSNNSYGPFNFVGPDGTAATYFTSSGASLSQFNGLRYLKYKAYFSTTNGTVTPTLNDITICYKNPRVWTGAVSSDWNNPANWTASGVPGSNDSAIIPTSGVANNPVNTTDTAINTLQLGSNRIVDTGGFTLTISDCSSSAVSGGSSTSYVKGSLTRCIGSSGTYSFPVGTNGYSPVSLTNTVGTGSFNVTPHSGVMGGVSSANSIQRYWSLSPSGGVTQADLTLNYLDSDVPSGANEANFNFIRRSGTINQSITPSSMNTTTNTFTLNGVNSFSDWTLGTTAPTAAGVSVSGQVVNSGNIGISNALLTIRSSTGEIRSAKTNSFGYFTFEDVMVGETYVVTVTAKRYSFSTSVISLADVIDNLIITAK